MHREDKERVVADLTARLRETETLIVADYRGLTMPQIDTLRDRLREQGARFSVVKNTLTRRAANEAGVEVLLALLEGPSAIAFVESESGIVDVARVLADSARETRVLAIRGGLMGGRTLSAGEVEELSRLPSFDVLRGQVLGAIVAPLSNLLGLVSAPLQNLVGLIDARIEQLGGVAGTAVADAGDPVVTGDPQEAGGDTSEPVDQATADAGGAGAEMTGEPESDSDDQEVDDGGS